MAFNFDSIDEPIAVTMYDESMKKIASYDSARKVELYTGIDTRMVTKLINATHSKPYLCKRLNKFVFLRKT